MKILKKGGVVDKRGEEGNEIHAPCACVCYQCLCFIFLHKWKSCVVEGKYLMKLIHCNKGWCAIKDPHGEYTSSKIGLFRRWKWWSPLAIYSAITKYRGVLVCVSCWINEFARHLFMDIFWQNMDVIVWNIYFPRRFVLFYIQHTLLQILTKPKYNNIYINN